MMSLPGLRFSACVWLAPAPIFDRRPCAPSNGRYFVTRSGDAAALADAGFCVTLLFVLVGVRPLIRSRGLPCSELRISPCPGQAALA